MLKNLKI